MARSVERVSQYQGPILRQANQVPLRCYQHRTLIIFKEQEDRPDASLRPFYVPAITDAGSPQIVKEEPTSGAKT